MTDKKKTRNAVAINPITDNQLVELLEKLNKDSILHHTKVSVIASLVNAKHKRECK